MNEKTSIDAMPKDYGFGSDEEMLRDLAKKLLDEEMPIEKMRRLVAADPTSTYELGRRPDWDESLWKQCVELGWTGLAVPEEAGGVGVKMVGIAALVEEVGKHGLASPLIATLIATFALREAGTEQARPWLERIADGTSASLAMTDAKGSWEPGSTDVVATASSGGLTLNGTAYFVQDAFKADVFVVNAIRDGASVLCVVREDASGLERSQDHIHDLTRDQATIAFENVSVA